MRTLISSGLRQHLCLAVLALTVWINIPTVQAATKTFDIIQTPSDTFHEVTVQSKSDKHVAIKHKNGFATIRVQDLAPEVQQALGYDEAAIKLNSNQRLNLADLPLDPKLAEAQSQMSTQVKEQISNLDKNVIIATLCLAFASFLFFSYCCHLICIKTGRPAGPAIWIPIIQIIPLLRAAGMSLWWFVFLFLPALLPLAITPAFKLGGPILIWALLGVAFLPSQLMSLIWCFKICRARTVSPIWGLLLLLPVTNFIAFLYLAFGGNSSTPPSVPAGSAADHYTRTNQDTSFFYQQT